MPLVYCLFLILGELYQTIKNKIVSRVCIIKLCWSREISFIISQIGIEHLFQKVSFYIQEAIFSQCRKLFHPLIPLHKKNKPWKESIEWVKASAQVTDFLIENHICTERIWFVFSLPVAKNYKIEAIIDYVTVLS